MRLFNFDFENILVWLMLFFGGCVSKSPPQPVEIETPKSISTQITNSENLIIEIKNEQTVNFTFKDQEGNLLFKDVKNELAELKNTVKEVIVKIGRKERLDIAVKLFTHSKYNSYSKVISALKANEIYQFKLVTTPE